MSIIFYNACMIGLVVGVAGGGEYIYVVYRVFSFFYQKTIIDFLMNMKIIFY